MLLARAFVVLVLATAATAQEPRTGHADLSGELKKLFEAGMKSTPSAIAAAKSQYEALRHSCSDDPRIDYAYALVLINQHQYRDAIPHIAGYLETAKPQLSAYCVSISAQMPLHAYPDVLDQARALADRFGSDPAAAPEKQFSDAAHFLGVVFAYLDLVRPSAVDATFRKDEEDHVLAQLGKTYRGAFDQGRKEVAQRLDDLQNQEKSRLENRKEQEQSTAEEARVKVKLNEERLQSGEQHFDDVQKEYARLQNQIVPLIANREGLQQQIMQARLQATAMRQTYRGNIAQAAEQSLRRSVTALERQVRDLDRQLAPIQSLARQLEVRARQENITLARANTQVRKNERIGADAEKRVHHEETMLNAHSGATEAKITLLSTYAPFPYEQEQRRILSWFSR